jgi:hypothetical protein
LLVVGFGLFVAAPARAASSGGATDRLFQLTNGSRADAGLPAYAYAGDLADVALGQAQREAAAHAISHNPNLADEVANWQLVSENVGRGPDADTVHQALMESPSHRRAILSTDLTELGIGVVQGDDGLIYVSEVFRLPFDQAEAAQAEPAPAEAAAPPAPPAEDPAPPAPSLAAPAAAPDATPAPAPAPTPTAAPVPVPVPDPAPVVVTLPTLAIPATPAPAAASAGLALPVMPAAAVTEHAQRPPLGLVWVAGLLPIAVLVGHLVVARRQSPAGGAAANPAAWRAALLPQSLAQSV